MSHPIKKEKKSGQMGDVHAYHIGRCQCENSCTDYLIVPPVPEEMTAARIP